MTNRIICPECPAGNQGYCIPNNMSCAEEDAAEARAQYSMQTIPAFPHAWVKAALEVLHPNQPELDPRDRSWQQTGHTQGLWYFHQADHPRPLSLTEQSKALIGGVTWAMNEWTRANVMYLSSSDGLLSIFQGLARQSGRVVQALDIRTRQGVHTFGSTRFDDDGGTIIAMEDDNLDSESREYLHNLCARNRLRPMNHPMYQIFVATAHSIQIAGAI